MKRKSIKTSLLSLAVGAFSCIGLGAISLNTATPVVADATQDATQKIFMAYGASTRLNDDFYGLRFKMAVTPAYYEAHTDTDGDYGMLIIPYDYLITYATALEQNENDYVKTFKKADVEVLNFTDMQGYAADEKYNPTTVVENVKYQCFNGVISSIKYNNLDRDFIAIGYYYDGTAYDYATFNEDDNARNVVEIADAALKDNATATSELYSTEQILRLYEYTFLNEKKAEQASEESAQDAYTKYKEGLLTKYVSDTTWVTLGQKQNITQMNSGDVLTLEFDILESDLGDIVKCAGLAIGPNVFGAVAPYSSKTYAVSLLTTYLTNFQDGTIRLYSVDTIKMTGTRNDTSYMGRNSLQGGKSLKYEYRPYISDTEKGSVTIYWKDVDSSSWTKAGSVEGIEEEFAPNKNVGIAFSGAGIRSLVVDNFMVSYNGESIETATKSVEDSKGNMVTVESDGAVLDTAFVPVGKAYTPDESWGIEEWTLNGEAYDITSPVMTNITIDGTIPMPEAYNMTIAANANHVWFSNDIALEKGRDITFEYTVKSVMYTSEINNGITALGSDDTKTLSWGNISGQMDQLTIQSNRLSAAVFPEGTEQLTKIKIVFKYDATSEKYDTYIYVNDVCKWVKDSPVPYNAYFGVTFIRFNVTISCEDVKCYDSEGNNLGVAGGVLDSNKGTITITPKND